MQKGRYLLDKLISEEALIKQFIAPVLRGGYVRIRIKGLVNTLKVKQRNYEGWAVLESVNSFEASVIRDAEFEEKIEYLDRLRTLRMTLVKRLRNKSWLAIPYNFSDARTRFKISSPKVVHLVEDVLPFDQVIVAVDGEVLWFKEEDERADFELAERLRKAEYSALNTKGLTPEQVQAFRIAHQEEIEKEEREKARRMEEKLQKALSVSGAKLVGYEDGRLDDSINVTWEWDGELHTVTIREEDFQVISAGICLEGHDSDYDLASVISVIRDRRKGLMEW
jgi:hypothetical protein